MGYEENKVFGEMVGCGFGDLDICIVCKGWEILSYEICNRLCVFGCLMCVCFKKVVLIF